MWGCYCSEGQAPGTREACCPFAAPRDLYLAPCDASPDASLGVGTAPCCSKMAGLHLPPSPPQVKSAN